jgi:hypothetical protein
VAEAWGSAIDFDWRHGRRASSRPEDEDDEDAAFALASAAKSQSNRRKEEEGDSGRQALDAMQPGRFWSATRPPRVPHHHHGFDFLKIK